MRANILIGGAAGKGPNLITHVLGETLVSKGYFVFYARDYQSLIRGGHNFNVLTFSDEPVYSNDAKVDVLVALDQKTIEIHQNELKDTAMVLTGKYSNIYFLGKLFKLLGLSFSDLDAQLQKLKRNYDENIKHAREGYEETSVDVSVGLKDPVMQTEQLFLNGSQGISMGAIKSGLDIYYAYPMTPATGVLTELAQKQQEKHILALELENEISVVNAAIGSGMTGAKVMVGTSGGGFDLMTETISLSGIAGIPLVVLLAQRPGPATGVPTYTSQGDLNVARHCGHGEFNRVVLAAGDPIECQEVTSQAFYFAHKYKVPTIILTDKHLAESFFTLPNEIKITPSEKSTTLTRFNSYETDDLGSATEDAEIIKKNIKARLNVGKQIKEEAGNFEQYKTFGKEESNNVVISWGSTKGAIRDAIKNLDAKFIQLICLDPFPERIKEELEGKNVILVENTATGQLAGLLSEQTGIRLEDKNKILRFDGRPFCADELRKELVGRLHE